MANTSINCFFSIEIGLTAIKVEDEVRTFYEGVKDIPDIEISVMPGQTVISDQLKALLQASPKFQLLSGNTTIKNIQNQFNHPEKQQCD